MTFVTGDIIDQRYKIISNLGSGASASVYLANEFSLDRKVAIKILHGFAYGPNKQEVQLNAIKRLEREAKALVKLRHQNIVNVYRLGLIDQQDPYIVMEYCEGQTLTNYIEQNSPLDCQTIVKVSQLICAGLLEAHTNNIIHRDLKPSNILVIKTMNSEIDIKILDFGLCRDIDANSTNNTLTKTGSILGSFSYMSPEQCLSRTAAERSDIFSLGCIIFEMITSMQAFPAIATGQLMFSQLTDSVPKLSLISPSSNLPNELDELIQKCTEKLPENRFQNISEIIKKLEHISALNCDEKFNVEDAKIYFSNKHNLAQVIPNNRTNKILKIFVLSCICLILCAVSLLQTKDGKILFLKLASRYVDQKKAIDIDLVLIHDLIKQKAFKEILESLNILIESENFQKLSLDEKQKIVYRIYQYCDFKNLNDSDYTNFSKELVNIKSEIAFLLLDYIISDWEELFEKGGNASESDKLVASDLIIFLKNSKIKRDIWMKIENRLGRTIETKSGTHTAIWKEAVKSFPEIHEFYALAAIHSLNALTEDRVEKIFDRYEEAAWLAQGLKRYDDSNKWFKDSLKVIESYEEDYRKFRVCVGVAENYYVLGKLDSAKKYINLAEFSYKRLKLNQNDKYGISFEKLKNVLKE